MRSLQAVLQAGEAEVWAWRSSTKTLWKKKKKKHKITPKKTGKHRKGLQNKHFEVRFGWFHSFFCSVFFFFAPKSSCRFSSGHGKRLPWSFPSTGHWSSEGGIKHDKTCFVLCLFFIISSCIMCLIIIYVFFLCVFILIALLALMFGGIDWNGYRMLSIVLVENMNHYNSCQVLSVTINHAVYMYCFVFPHVSVFFNRYVFNGAKTTEIAVLSLLDRFWLLWIDRSARQMQHHTYKTRNTFTQSDPKQGTSAKPAFHLIRLVASFQTRQTSYRPFQCQYDEVYVTAGVEIEQGSSVIAAGWSQKVWLHFWSIQKRFLQGAFQVVGRFWKDVAIIPTKIPLDFRPLDVRPWQVSCCC